MIAGPDDASIGNRKGWIITDSFAENFVDVRKKIEIPMQLEKPSRFQLGTAAATTGKRPIDARSAINSRGLAVPTVILLSKASRSNTPSNDERVSSNSTSELTSSPTASKRDEDFGRSN